MKRNKKDGADTMDATTSDNHQGPRTGPARLLHGELKRVPIGMVRPDPNQPRKYFDPATLKELAESIREQGILQPPLVQWRPAWTILEPDLITPEWHRLVDDKGQEQEKGPLNLCRMTRESLGRDKDGYELVDGERRYLAAQLAGLEEIPVHVVDMDERTRLLAQLTSNQARENLTALEEAAGYEKALHQTGGSAEALAGLVGISRSTMFNRLALLRLSEPLQAALRDGKIEQSVAVLISRVPERSAQEWLLKEITTRLEWQEPLSCREVELLIQEDYCRSLAHAPFDAGAVYEGTFKMGLPEGTDGTLELLPMGDCTTCKHRTGNMAEVDKTKDQNTCTLPPCYQAKCLSFYRLEAAALEAKGERVVESLGSAKKDYVAGDARPVTANYSRNDTWEAYMGKRRPKAVHVATPQGIQRWYLKEEALAAAHANGIKFPAAKQQKPKQSQEEQKQAEKAKREKLERWTRAKHIAVGRAFEAIEKMSDAKAWAFLAQHGCEVWGEYKMTIAKHARSDKSRAIAATLSDDLLEPSTKYGDIHWLPESVELYKHLGIDLKAIQKECERGGKEEGAHGSADKSAKGGKRA